MRQRGDLRVPAYERGHRCIAAEQDRGPRSCLSVMLVHGAGGQGKTRLMQRFADVVSGRDGRPQVWEAFSLTEIYAQMPGEEHEASRDADPSAEILLLVDEADAWAQGKLRTLFAAAATWRCERLRVLLTARSAGEWWPGLRAEHYQALYE